MQNKTHAELFAKLFEISDKSFYRWKTKDHVSLVRMIEKYFTDDDIVEFLESGSVSRFEMLPNTEQVLKQVESKIKHALDRFLNNYDYDDCIYKINDINRTANSKNQKTLLIALNENKNARSGELSTDEKVAFTAAISGLTAFEFQVAINRDLI